MLKQDGHRLSDKRKGEPSSAPCDRSLDQTRARSPRQLPTNHDYAGRPQARSANIRVINRRVSRLGLCPSCFNTFAFEKKKKKRNAPRFDRSLHIRGEAYSPWAASSAAPTGDHSSTHDSWRGLSEPPRAISAAVTGVKDKPRSSI